MKARELQIGDWIKIGECDRYHGFIGKIAAINSITNYCIVRVRIGDDIFVQSDVFIEDIEPTPLTPKILEKNGFKKIDFSHYQIHDRTLVLDADGQWDSELSWHWVVTEMSTNSKGQNVVLDYYVATINYVHTLQHALRLCGLNELADNFQI